MDRVACLCGVNGLWRKRFTVSKTLFAVVIAFIPWFAVVAQAHNVSGVSLNFRFDNAIVDSAYMNNKAALLQLDTLMANFDVENDTIVLVTSASIERPASYNRQLLSRRADSLAVYMLRKYKQVSRANLEKVVNDESIGDLQQVVAADERVPYKADILDLLASGNPDPDILENSLKQLRSVTTISVSGARPAESRFFITDVFSPAIPVTSLYNSFAGDKTGIEKQRLRPVINYARVRNSFEPVLAVKTNALYFLALIPNIEVEMSVSTSFSVNAEVQYGWWLKKDNTFCWQLCAYSVEGRYWLPRQAFTSPKGKVNVSRKNYWNRQNTSQMNLTGWFLGAYFSRAIADFQLKDYEGYQADVNFMAGLSGGYSMPVAKNFNIELSAGFGYMNTTYSRYEVLGGQLMKMGDTMRKKSLYPGKAKVSLVWLIDKDDLIFWKR